MIDTKDTIWLEVWIDSASLDYILILVKKKNLVFEIYDPHEKRIIQQFNLYAEAVTWLNEDEYDLIEGRYEMLE